MSDSQTIQTQGAIIPPPINEHGRVDTSSYLQQLLVGYQVAALFMQVIAMPGEVLIRRKFGERYLDPLMVLLGFAGIFILGASGSLLSRGTANSLFLFAFLYLGLAVLHRLAILHRDLKGQTWHSQSAGLSYPVLTLPARLAGNLAGRFVPVSRLGTAYRGRLEAMVAEYVHMFVEPLLIGMAGLAMVEHEIMVGELFPLIAIGMLVKNVLHYHMERTRVLDTIDASIETEHRADVLTGAKGPEEAQGYRVSGVRLPSRAFAFRRNLESHNEESDGR